MLEIQTGENNPILRQKAEKVEGISAEIKQLALDMAEMIESEPNDIGLAAPQVNHSLCIIVVQPDKSKKALILINPEIKKVSTKKETMPEGCLSLPNVIVPVERPFKITAQALDLKGNKIKIKAKGLFARVIQHEVDHLHGVLIVDYR
jgi:peptide deformylase